MPSMPMSISIRRLAVLTITSLFSVYSHSGWELQGEFTNKRSRDWLGLSVDLSSNAMLAIAGGHESVETIGKIDDGSWVASTHTGSWRDGPYGVSISQDSPDGGYAVAAARPKLGFLKRVGGSALTWQTTTSVEGLDVNSVDLRNSRAVVGGNGQAFVYQYDGSKGLWKQQQQLVPASPHKEFGTSVAITSGYVAVSGHGYDGFVSVYRFRPPRGDYVLDATLPLDRPGGAPEIRSSGFGFDLDIFSTTPYPGIPSDNATLVVAGGGTTHGGPVYVFERAASGWGRHVLIERTATGATPSKPSDNVFGGAVALDSLRVAIGAPQVGKVYLYKKTTAAGWVENSSVSAPSWAAKKHVPDGGFGSSVDIEGDNLIVGFPGRVFEPSNANSPEGAVYLYRFELGK